ncbi:hypothetical protein [Streptomyces sp. NPDC046821]|uniref:hypothetical protein n=1 Tax=Streptomyces sp. NPDC046821 TaxID=3154702 RepID=UPI0033F9A522
MSEARPKQPRPTPIDEALERLLTEPSYAAQTLIVTARLLEMDAAEPLTPLARKHALTIASDAILAKLPDVVRRDSIDRALVAMPDLDTITRGEYALRLRDAAKSL